MTDEEKRDLNAKLAERLFGWIWLRREWSHWRWLGPSSDIDTGPGPTWGSVRAVRPDEMDECKPEDVDIPDYAGTWEGAGLVVEAMRKRGYGAHFNTGGLLWFVRFGLLGITCDWQESARD